MYIFGTFFVLSNLLLLGFFLVSEILQNPEVCLLFLLIFSNVFQTSFPRVQDVWLANFDNQLAACFEPVQQEVVVPPRADQQLLHGDVPASLPGMGGGDAVVAVQDAAAATVRDELPDVRMIRDVGSVVVNEPVVPKPVGVRDDALMVQGVAAAHDRRDGCPRDAGSGRSADPGLDTQHLRSVARRVGPRVDRGSQQSRCPIDVISSTHAMHSRRR